jgi:hypothetical protein
MRTQAPSSLTLAQVNLRALEIVTTPGVYEFSDPMLHGTTVNTELPIDDPADPNVILAASRQDCRYISLTLTFSPQQVTPGGAIIQRARLPTATSLRVYFSAPQNPAGGLNDTVTKAIQ